MVPINVNKKEFDMLMSIYKKALDNIEKDLTLIKKELNQVYGYDIINNITSRIKTPKSIINKMKKKNYELNYKNLIENVNDIAGLRVICPLKSNIYTVLQVINNMPNIEVLKEKDYLTKPKKSGYSGYHLIIQTMIEIDNEKIPVKVEIQLRTMAMDFWSTNEHKMKYKTNKKLSSLDSKKLTLYAKILNFIDEKISRLYQKQEKGVYQ